MCRHLSLYSGACLCAIIAHQGFRGDEKGGGRTLPRPLLAMRGVSPAAGPGLPRLRGAFHTKRHRSDKTLVFFCKKLPQPHPRGSPA